MNSEQATSGATSSTIELKWKEVYSLTALSAAVAISWISYHEYQPQLLENFGLGQLGAFLVLAKGMVLVIIPPIAGWLSDIVMRRTGRFFMIFSVGIGTTAMVFMAVASIIGAGALSQLANYLPVMIVLWLIAMNIFTSPALSMIDSFAPTQKLPLVVGVLFFVTQLIYALEPVIVQVVDFMGPTVTFVFGGILILSTGFIFQKVSSDEVATRRKEVIGSDSSAIKSHNLLPILGAGLILGTANAFLVEYFPMKAGEFYVADSVFGSYFSFGLLGVAALLAVFVSGFVARKGFDKVIVPASVGILLSTIMLLLSNDHISFTLSGVLLAVCFAFMNVSALPYAISKLPARHITLGIGAFIGTSYILEGILEYMQI